jgi:hypothetical protein
MKNEGNNLDEVAKLLRVLVALQIKGTSDSPRSLREQISLLSGIGLSPRDIATVIGRTRAYVSKELTLLKQKGDSNAQQ